MRLASLLTFVAVLLPLGACARTPVEVAFELVYETEPEQAEAVADVLRARLQREGEVVVGRDGVLRVGLPDGADVEATRTLLETPGKVRMALEASPRDLRGVETRLERAALLTWVESHPDGPRPDRPKLDQAGLDWAVLEDGGERRIVFLARPELPEWRFTEADITDVAATQDVYGHPAVSLELRAGRAEALGELTAMRLGRSLAVVVDGRVLVLARIEEAIEGRFLIHGSAEEPFTVERVLRMVQQLRSGALPAPLRFVELRR